MHIGKSLRNSILIVLACITVLAAAGCSSTSDTAEEAVSTLVTVGKGNLTTEISATGNLTLSTKDDLAFEVAGTVEEVMVSEGDVVESGQILATLDTSELQDALEAAESSVRAAERSVTSAEMSLESAQTDYEQMTYPYTLRTFSFSVPQSLDAIDDTQISLKKALEELSANFNNLTIDEFSAAIERIKEAQTSLNEAEEQLSYGSGSYEGITSISAYANLRDVEMGLTRQEMALEKAMEDLDTAQSSLTEAQENMEKAIITAPFDGFITLVNVEGGDEIMSGTVAVQLADTDRFEASVLVGEMDIFSVALDSDAIIAVDAINGMSYPARVTHISPTATISSGVVNYEVDVELLSNDEIQAQRQQAMTDSITKGELPATIQQAIDTGEMTQEQAKELMKISQEQSNSTIQLREGLTVSVTIIVSEVSDVLLVPNNAISVDDGVTYVTVMAAGEETKREIATGASNWQYTEVVSGLDEGEQVVITASSLITTEPASSPSTIRMPLMGGGSR